MIELELLGVSSDGQLQHVVLLRHKDRVLPILVGPMEAEAIHLGLLNKKIGRPLTHDLICNLLAGLRGELRSVTIYKLENDTFFAHLNIEQKAPDGTVEQVLRVDSRPSDGIAIATRVKCPIYAAEEVLDQAGQDLSIASQEETDEGDASDSETDE